MLYLTISLKGHHEKPVYYAYVTQETQPDLQGDKKIRTGQKSVAFSHNGSPA